MTMSSGISNKCGLPDKRNPATQLSALSMMNVGMNAGMIAPGARQYSAIYRMNNLYEVRQGVGLETHDYHFSQGGQPRFWTPSVAYQARAAAIGWLSRTAATPEDQEKTAQIFR